MKDSTYLIFDKSGIREMRKRHPKLKAGEFAVKIEIEVDNVYFDQAIPTAKLKIDKGDIIRPPVDVTLQEPFFGKKPGKKVKAK